MAAAAMKFLEAERAAHPSLARDYAEFADLYHRKLWHQLTLRIERFAAAHAAGQPADGDAELLPRLYDRFVRDFEAKLSPLRLVKIAMCVAQRLPTPSARRALFAPLLQASRGVQSDASAHALALAAEGHYALDGGDAAGARDALDAATAALSSGAGLDASAYAHTHHLAMLFHQQRREHERFFRAGLAHLSYVSLASVPREEQRRMARDLALAALLAPETYNVGELLQSPVCERLGDALDTAWLLPLLQAFNAGDIRAFAELLARAEGAAADDEDARALLAQNEAQLREKICVLALMELVFRRPTAGDRRLPIAELAAATGLSDDAAERLAMRALALGLVRGSIDGVERVFEVTWIQPRVLGREQIETMVAKIDDWAARIATAIHSLDSASSSSSDDGGESAATVVPAVPAVAQQ